MTLGHLSHCIHDIVVLIVASGCLTLVRADVPVHCVQPQILGQWRFHIGGFHSDSSPKGWDANCGGSIPDKPDGHRHLTPKVNKNQTDRYYLSSRFEKFFSIDLVMKDWTSQVTSVSPEGQHRFSEDANDLPRGEWTMVYDEGFMVSLRGGDRQSHTFFAFSKFMLEGGEKASEDNPDILRHHSFCDTTLLGWYKQIDPVSGNVVRNECFWGERVDTLHDAIVSPPILPIPDRRNSTLPRERLRGHDVSSKVQPLPQSVPKQSSAGSWASELFTSLSSGVALTSRQSSIAMVSLAVLPFLLHFFVSRSSNSEVDKGEPELRYNLSYFIVGYGCILAAIFVLLALWCWTQRHSALAFEPKAPTINEVANRLQEGIHKSSKAGIKVRWQADPSKLAAWVRERSEVHGIEISEHSDVIKLLNVVSPPLAIGVPGFGTEQVIGPARQVAIRDQEAIAQSLKKPMSELSIDDVKPQWNVSSTNHHHRHAFTLDGKPLDGDGWRHLKNFDWRKVSMQFGNSTISNFVPEVPDQGPCGSCYAFAATSMYSARLMLGYPHLHATFGAHRGADRVSAQQQVYCNPYNQGCEGGYPFLISKWSSENTLYTEECVRQNAASGKECPSTAQGAACRHRFRVHNWRYLGGALGRCGMHHLCEEAMREELYKGGPFPVSMDPPDEMIAYSGGVFHSYPGLEDHNLIKEFHTRNDTMSCGDTECFVWRKVGHSVLVVGWGEDDSEGLTCQPRAHRTAETENYNEPGCEEIRRQEDCEALSACIWRGFPYWVIQNSWGKNYGEDGYIRIGPRGSNPRWIESFPMAADMELLPPEHHHSRMTPWHARHKTMEADDKLEMK